MTDSHKNSLLVVVLILSVILHTTMAFTQDLQHYTSEISRRSYSLLEFLEPDSTLMTFGEPVFKTITFVVAAIQFFRMVLVYIPGLQELLEMFGVGGLPLLGQMPTEMSTAREQRQIDQLDHKVQASIAQGQAEFENELKKKKK